MYEKSKKLVFVKSEFKISSKLVYNFFMNIEKYTDKKYIPASELKPMGSVFLSESNAYRQQFREIIQINEEEYANIVETPKLVKKRWNKNFEIKGMIPKQESNDLILELSKLIVINKDNLNIPAQVRKSIFKKYIDNAKDLTIISTWLIENINDYIRNTPSGDIHHLFPELSEKDQIFLMKYNNPQLSYSIKDYKDLNNTSYETSRKALERMAQLKFYEKTKISKKFVYKPTQLLEETIKGGI